MATIESGATIRNGVDTAKLFATLDAVRAQPAAAQFTFRVANRWISGTHSENRISGFFGVGVEQDRVASSSSRRTTQKSWSATTTARRRPRCSSVRSRPA